MTHLRRLTTLIIGAAATAVTLAAAPGVALAQPTPTPPPSGEVLTEGRQYGKKDGFTIETREVEIVPGGGPVGAVFDDVQQPLDATFNFGSSYATSREIAFVSYRGTAKAAGNVFQGRRIVSVTIRYLRDGRTISGPATSNALCSGPSFRPGPEVALFVFDNLASNPTLFRYSTGRVDPRVTC